MKHQEITNKIIGAAYTVHKHLGYGFLEKVYENALRYELVSQNLEVVNQKPLQVWYKNNIVGEYLADTIVENLVIVEIKAIRELAPIHETQLVNYLKATNIEVGLLINFGPKIEIKRKIFDNDRKTSGKKQLDTD
ncbi:MAG: GxxExxY protein [bacterium]|nr:GxxExxY protein [bacterium]